LFHGVVGQSSSVRGGACKRGRPFFFYAKGEDRSFFMQKGNDIEPIFFQEGTPTEAVKVLAKQRKIDPFGWFMKRFKRV